MQKVLLKFNLTVSEVQMSIRLLFRGEWARSPEQQEYKTCRAMCDYIKRTSTISLHTKVHKRPLYVGCYVKFKENDENANILFSPLEIDCTQ